MGEIHLQSIAIINQRHLIHRSTVPTTSPRSPPKKTFTGQRELRLQVSPPCVIAGLASDNTETSGKRSWSNQKMRQTAKLSHLVSGKAYVGVSLEVKDRSKVKDTHFEGCWLSIGTQPKGKNCNCCCFFPLIGTAFNFLQGCRRWSDPSNEILKLAENLFYCDGDKTDELDCSMIQLHGTLVNFFFSDDAKSVWCVIASVKRATLVSRGGLPRCMLLILDRVLSVFIRI